MYIAENLKTLRKLKDLTQEEAAELVGVSAQSVSKWERGETYPDITLLPVLANLYKVSVDALIGMDKINDEKTRAAVFTKGHEFMRNGDAAAAVKVYADALKSYPEDAGVMSDLAMALALHGPDRLDEAAGLCERVLSGGGSVKARHTARAALCFIYYKSGEKDKAAAAAKNLPHLRESREKILSLFKYDPSAEELDAYLKFLMLGEGDAEDIILVDFAPDMIPMFEECGLLEKIEALRNETGAVHTEAGYRRLPVVRMRDEAQLPPGRVRVRHYADYLLDEDFTDHAAAADKILAVLRQIAEKMLP